MCISYALHISNERKRKLNIKLNKSVKLCIPNENKVLYKDIQFKSNVKQVVLLFTLHLLKLNSIEIKKKLNNEMRNEWSGES